MMSSQERNEAALCLSDEGPPEASRAAPPPGSRAIGRRALDANGRSGVYDRDSAPRKNDTMHRYRSHTCGDLRAEDIGQEVRLSGWCHRIRDHGGVLFIDLRDHYGVTQCVADPDSPAYDAVQKARSEWVVKIDGRVRQRPGGTENPELPTGAVEIFVTAFEVLGPAAELPMPVFGDHDYPED